MPVRITSAVISCILTLGLPAVASAATETTLYNFPAPDALHLSAPWLAPVIDSHGNLFGVAQYGGPAGVGGVFEISAAGAYSISVFSKAPAESLYGIGLGPGDSLILTGSGAGKKYFPLTPGAIGWLLPDGTTRGVEFPDAANQPEGPTGTIVPDHLGNLVGVTQQGVFRRYASGVFALIPYNGYDAYYGIGEINPTTDQSGNIYTTTSDFSSDTPSSVYQISPDNVFTTLHTFDAPSGTQACYFLQGGLLLDHHHTLFGTSYGGCIYQIALGSGFRLLAQAPADASLLNGSLVEDAAGNLYGTSLYGGSAHDGTVFEVKPDGEFITLYTFSGTDGANPGSLAIDPQGNLYGTSTTGGAQGAGLVFKITP